MDTYDTTISSSNDAKRGKRDRELPLSQVWVYTMEIVNIYIYSSNDDNNYNDNMIYFSAYIVVFIYIQVALSYSTLFWLHNITDNNFNFQ